MKPKRALPYSEEPNTFPCCEADESALQNSALFFVRSVLVLISHVGLPNDVLLSYFPTKISCVFLTSPIRAKTFTSQPYFFLIPLLREDHKL
jgi:hypothetical protein